MSKPTLHVVSFSGGKDSTAMLLRMLEEGMPIDIILFNDTGVEFPEMYEHIKRVEQNIGRKVTVIKYKHSYEYMLLKKTVNKHNGTKQIGLSWAGTTARWCTYYLKYQCTERYLRELRKEYKVLEYVGLAADELRRLERDNNKRECMRFPLVDWGMTEADCLKYCYDKGYDWGGLYRFKARASCWCCPLQSINDLRVLYKNFPELWKKLKDWDSKTFRSFRSDYSLDELEVRFKLADEWEKNKKNIRSRAFLKECKDQCILQGIKCLNLN